MNEGKNAIEAAQARVQAAHHELAQALLDLRVANGTSHDEACKSCDGTGKDPLAALRNLPDEPCDTCEGRGHVRKQFPLIVNSFSYGAEDKKRIRPGLFGKKPCWASIRPCGKEYEGKTFLGWYLGDMALAPHVSFIAATGALTVSLGYYNPAIFVPDLGRIIFGCESWWGEIKSAADLRTITDADIQNVWYMRALDDLGK